MNLEADKKLSGCRGRQGEDVVWLNFRENPSQKRGVVDSLGVAIVIKQSDEFPHDHFVDHCSMKATIDFKYSVDDEIRELTGEREELFPFNPKTKSIVIPKRLDLNALGDYVEIVASSQSWHSFTFLSPGNQINFISRGVGLDGKN